jgi:hypothetical protein
MVSRLIQLDMESIVCRKTLFLSAWSTEGEGKSLGLYGYRSLRGHEMMPSIRLREEQGRRGRETPR